MEPERVFTVNELAEFLRVDRATVYKLPLGHTKVGGRRRYLLSDVTRYLNSNHSNLDVRLGRLADDAGIPDA